MLAHSTVDGGERVCSVSRTPNASRPLPPPTNAEQRQPRDQRQQQRLRFRHRHLPTTDHGGHEQIDIQSVHFAVFVHIGFILKRAVQQDIDKRVDVETVDITVQVHIAQQRALVQGVDLADQRDIARRTARCRDVEEELLRLATGRVPTNIGE